MHVSFSSWRNRRLRKGCDVQSSRENLTVIILLLSAGLIRFVPVTANGIRLVYLTDAEGPI